MSQADLPDQSPAFQLKGSMLAITVLELASNDIERLDEQLAAKVEQAPDFFNNTPLVLALDKLPEAAREIDIKALVALCRKHRLRTLPCAPASRRISKQRRCWIYRCCRLRGSRAPGRPGIEGSGQTEAERSTARPAWSPRPSAAASRSTHRAATSLCWRR